MKFRHLNRRHANLPPQVGCVPKTPYVLQERPKVSTAHNNKTQNPHTQGRVRCTQSRKTTRGPSLQQNLRKSRLFPCLSVCGPLEKRKLTTRSGLHWGISFSQHNARRNVLHCRHILPFNVNTLLFLKKKKLLFIRERKFTRRLLSPSPAGGEKSAQTRLQWMGEFVLIRDA